MTVRRTICCMTRKSRSWGRIDGLPDEATVLADIAYFESRVTTLSGSDLARDRASLQVYRLLLRQRRQLLAAIRDGVPERWPEYAES